MQYTLLVYSLIPEETNFYLIPQTEETKEILEIVEQAHGTIGNSFDKENRATHILCDMLAQKGEYCSNTVPKKFRRCLNQYKQDMKKPLISNITKVINAGFFL